MGMGLWDFWYLSAHPREKMIFGVRDDLDTLPRMMNYLYNRLGCLYMHIAMMRVKECLYLGFVSASI